MVRTARVAVAAAAAAGLLAAVAPQPAGDREAASENARPGVTAPAGAVMGAYTGPLGTDAGTGATGSGLAAFETWNRGRDLYVASDFITPDAGWGPIQYPTYWTEAWGAQALRDDFRLSIALPMLPWTSSARTAVAGTLAQGAAGHFDAYFTSWATHLSHAGLGDSFVRLGWEMNGNWYPWQGSSAADWIAFYQRIVSAIRAVDPDFVIEWNPAAGVGSYDPETLYPGDGYVDVIGLDVYDQGWDPGWADPATRWSSSILGGPRGLLWHKRFAAAHGKPVSFPEWGLATRPDGHGGGDNPAFIHNMYAWMNTFTGTGGNPALAYHSYFDYPSADVDPEISAGQYPAAGRALRY